MTWRDPIEDPPPQGKKVLWLHNGDIQIAQRYGLFWFPVPFLDSKYAKIHPPELWQDIILPSPLTGKVMFQGEGHPRLIDADELEMMEPEVYDTIIKYHLEIYAKGRKDVSGE
jgi:hypothetical protein